MSTSLGAHARRHRLRDARRLGSLAAATIILALLAVGVASADLPPAATRLSAADAASGGSAVRLLRHPVGGATLLEVQPATTAPATASTPGPSLLAVSADGGQVALADRIGDPSGQLTIARGDGSQLRVQLPGLLAAGYAVDGAWLAVLDARGALWQVDAQSGRAAKLADGPFLGSPIAAVDGSLLLLSVPSVEAPYRSRLVRLAPSTGAITPLSSDQLVYGGFPLADGSVALAAHEPGTTVVREVGRSGERLLADLGPGAVNVAVAADGRRIAFEEAGRGVFLIDGPGSRPRGVGVGSRPCFPADGSSLLLRRGGGTVAVSLAGSVLAVTDGMAGFAGAVGCLP